MLPLLAQILATDAIPTTMSATVVHEGTQQDVPIDREIDIDVGDFLQIHFRAIDTKNATYVVTGLPPTAHAQPADDGIDVLWTPADEDAGSHDVVIQVTDSGGRAERALHVTVEHTHHAIFVPGAIASVFVPNDAPRLGAFVGGGLEILLYSFLQRGHRWFPSHGRFYVNLEVLGSTQPGVDGMLQAVAGADITLERSPGRRVLLPFIGAEGGVAFQKQAGTYGWAMPVAGLYLYASPRARFALKGGYLLPSTGEQDVRGVRVALSLDYGWW